MCGAGSLVHLETWISKLFKMQNLDGRLILTAEVTKNKMAKTTKIYFNKFARYFGLQHKPSSSRGLNGKRLVPEEAFLGLG